ncbi:MAG: hypothetical protein ACQESR_00710 [Planctomycetota bacterium]
MGPNDSIPINRESVIGFLRQQKAGGKQAWQRLQMVKAIQFYQTAVPRTHAPPLDDIREKLNEFARQHPVAMSNNSSVIDVAGQIDPNEPEPIQLDESRMTKADMLILLVFAVGLRSLVKHLQSVIVAGRRDVRRRGGKVGGQGARGWTGKARVGPHTQRGSRTARTAMGELASQSKK